MKDQGMVEGRFKFKVDWEADSTWDRVQLMVVGDRIWLMVLHRMQLMVVGG